ncbi:MAG TPA: LysE family transporter [Bacteroidota bacterium]|nr:LysE family transporter [Bacteroidota bacterium]
MLESIFIGCGFAFAAAVQPGPLQAFLFSSVMQKGWRRTLPASFAPLLSDGPIAVLMIFLLNHVPTTMRVVLQAAGGIVLLYFAYTGYKQWKEHAAVETDSGASPKTFWQAFTVNILNPNVYIGWSLVMGPAVISAWKKGVANAAILVLAFYCTMVASLACMIVLFGTSKFLSDQHKRMLILVSAILLGAIGVYQLFLFFSRSLAQ